MKHHFITPLSRFNLHFIVVILALIITISGCKKEIETSPHTSAIVLQSADNAVTTTSRFGAMIADMEIDDRLTVCDMLRVKYVRDQIILKGFTKAPGIDKYLNNGYKLILNLNYNNVLNAKGEKVAVPFPKDMTEYKKLLGTVLDKYKPEVAVIENEPTTNIYHSGPIEDYITELTNAVDVCKQKGVKVADGGLILELVQQVMNGYGSGEKYNETKKLINAYKTIKLDYVNIHTKAPGSADNPDAYRSQLQKAADYLRTQTGKEVICNEYGQGNTSADFMTSTVNAFRGANYKYVITRSADNSKAKPLSNGTTSLTTIGKAYKAAIRQ